MHVKLFFETTPGVKKRPQNSKSNGSKPLDHVVFNNVIVCTPQDTPKISFWVLILQQQLAS